MAEQFGIRLSVNATDLRASINEAIDKINSSGGLHKVKISADTSEISKAIKNLKTELQSITKKSVTPKITLGTSRSDGQVTLEELDEYKKTQQEIAANPKGLTAVQTDFKKTATVVKALTAAVKDFKRELSNIEIGNIKTLNEQFSRLNQNITGKNATQKTTKRVKSSAGNSVADKLREQQQLQSDVAKTVQATNQKEISSEITKMQAYEKTNALMEQRVKLVRTLGGEYNKYESRRMGNAVESQTVTTLNGEVHTISSVANYEKQRKEIEKNYAAAGKLAAKLEDIKVKYADVNGIKPITNTNSLDDLNAKYSAVNNKITELSQASAETSTRIKADIERQIAELERLVKQYQNVEYAATSLRTKDISTIKAEQLNEIDKFTQNILRSSVPLNMLKGKIDTLKISLANVTDKDTLVKFLNDFDILNSEFDALNSKAKATSDISKQISRNIDGLEKIANNSALYRNKGYNTAEYNSLIGSVNTLKSRYLELQATIKTDSSLDNLNKVKTKLTELEEELKKTGVQAANLKKSFNNIKIDGANSRKIAQTLGIINETVRKNSLAMGKIDTLSGNNLTFRDEFEQLQYQLKTSPETVDIINNKLRVLQANIKALGLEGNTVLGDFKEKTLKFIKWTGMTLLVTKVRMYIRKLFTTVYELDTALIDLRKTFSGTNEELENFYLESNKIAKQMGVSTKEIIEQSSAWSRLGYSTSEASKKMAEMSSMFSAISPDMDVEQATDGLVSIMKAFDIAPNDVLDGILSKVNIIGNTASTSNGEIVEMLKRSSSAMKEANNTLEQTIALETAAVEIVRDADAVGTAYKTISMRIRGYSEETESYSEDVEKLSGEIADLTKTASTPGGISLFTDSTKSTYKSTYQLLKDISEIYDKLTDKQQAESCLNVQKCA